MSVGIGFDAHRFARGRALVLGGVRIPHARGLSGHSDADVLCHAVADAVLGAAGMGDLGRSFPDTDERHRGRSSLAFLRGIAGLLRRRRLRAAHVDCVLIGERPRIAPYAPAMSKRIAHALGIPAAAVNVKGKTTERMGALGRGQGLAAMAVASVARADRRRA